MNIKRLKKTLLCVFIAIFTMNSFAQPLGSRLFISVDGLAPALKFGFEKVISDRLSLKTSLGACIVGPGLLSYNFYGNYIITRPEKTFGCTLHFGFPDNYIDVLTPMFSLGLGGGAGIYYRFKNYSVLTFRLGIISGPSVDNGKYAILTLPNYGIEYAFKFRNKNSSKHTVRD
ncbi:MAG TPA: hypothetical protein PLP11_02070 [Bacteroidales bacterium]|nr:hypothetical protein [Bacteroidales bacterium]